MPVSNMVDSLITAADSVQTTSGNDSGWILHHIMDSRELNFEPFFTIHIPQFPTLFGLDITPTKHVFFMWLTALLLLILFYIVARSYKKSLVPKGIANVFEVLILFVRDEIVKPTLGEGYEKFVPYLLTLFFFILFGNLLGLIPYSSTFTSNIAVTANHAKSIFFSLNFC